MTETMEAVKVIVPCPSCARPMAVIGDSWQCLACNPIPEDIPICATQKCQKPLTKLGDPWNCWICLRCNTHPEEVSKEMKQRQIDQQPRPYVKDAVPYPEFEKLQEQVAELLKRPDYPPPQAEINQIAAPILENVTPIQEGIKPESYLKKAKRLGVATHIPTGGMRKKVEIMADIETKELHGVTLENKENEDDSFREESQNAPGDDDNYARGLTAEEMM